MKRWRREEIKGNVVAAVMELNTADVNPPQSAITGLHQIYHFHLAVKWQSRGPTSSSSSSSLSLSSPPLPLSSPYLPFFPLLILPLLFCPLPPDPTPPHAPPLPPTPHPKSTLPNACTLPTTSHLLLLHHLHLLLPPPLPPDTSSACLSSSSLSSFFLFLLLPLANWSDGIWHSECRLVVCVCVCVVPSCPPCPSSCPPLTPCGSLPRSKAPRSRFLTIYVPVPQARSCPALKPDAGSIQPAGASRPPRSPTASLQCRVRRSHCRRGTGLAIVTLKYCRRFTQRRNKLAL